ncbi:hypothetical protein PHYBOEH_006116 [Phytophthora boehmeriae]|uniref:RxLR effector protein n=1 Tax=Phytophthora boehmeriae TaxID=109152 RepID=A0A8T1X9E2_9STRA|nr:hypothetical protein PHYBOEH_006116 [Phytophthora boehmeriae]
MRLYSTLFVVLLALLATSDTLATTTDSKVLALVSHDIPTSVSIETGNKRILRTAETSNHNGDNDLTDSTNIEERKIEVPAGLKKLGMKFKRRFWLEFGMSDDYIKEALGMKGLTGKKLKEHKNYKHFEWIRFRKDGDILNGWLRQEPPLPTFDAWTKLGLENMVLKNVPLKEIVKTDEYATYARYVEGFDRFIIRTRNSLYRPKNQIPRTATETEMTAKAEIWGRTQMTDDYVLYALGLDKLKREDLVKNSDYQKFFLRFKEVKEETKN